MSTVLLALILLPLLGSLMVFFWKENRSKYFALFLSFAQLMLTVSILPEFDFSLNVDQTLQHEINLSWIEVVNTRIHLGIDGLSLALLLLVNSLIPIIIFSSFNEPKEKRYPNYFYALILLMQFGLMGVFTALDGLVFYIFWEVTLIPITFISGIWGQEDKRIKVTKKFFIYTFAGSLFMLLGLIYTYQFSDSFALIDLYNAKLNLNDQILVFWFIFLALAVKLPLFPVHTWLPDAHTFAPTQGSMLLSGIMLKMAVFGILRWLIPITPLALASGSGYIALILGIVGSLYGALIALVQNNTKTVVAYSSISHLGMMAAGIFSSALLTISGNITNTGFHGAILQTFAHGINAVGLFYCTDVLYKRAKTKDLREMGGFAKAMPKFAVLFMILLLGSIAIPLTNGFVGEFMILKTIFSYNYIIGIIAGSCIVIGAMYMLRMYERTMLGKANDDVLSQVKDVTKVEFTTLFVLAFAVLFFGIFPNYIIEMVKYPLDFILSKI